MPLIAEAVLAAFPAPASVEKKPEVRVFAVDPSRSAYKGTIPVRALTKVWFDEGYQVADKGAVFKVDAMDAELLLAAKHVEKLDAPK